MDLVCEMTLKGFPHASKLLFNCEVYPQSTYERLIFHYFSLVPNLDP